LTFDWKNDSYYTAVNTSPQKLTIYYRTILIAKASYEMFVSSDFTPEGRLISLRNIPNSSAPIKAK
jgi:hypothetical protein